MVNCPVSPFHIAASQTVLKQVIALVSVETQFDFFSDIYVQAHYRKLHFPCIIQPKSTISICLSLGIPLSKAAMFRLFLSPPIITPAFGYFDSR